MNDQRAIDIVDRISEVVTQLHYVWSLYREVYAGTPEQTALLNRNGSNFFFYTQQLMLDHIALVFSKLTDPDRQGRFENLSLKQIHSYVNGAENRELMEKLKAKFEEISQACETFRIRRHKKIAHADLAHELKISPQPLPGFSGDDVENALSLLREFMSLVEKHFFDRTVVYQATSGSLLTGGRAVIAALERSESNDV